MVGKTSGRRIKMHGGGRLATVAVAVTITAALGLLAGATLHEQPETEIAEPALWVVTMTAEPSPTYSVSWFFVGRVEAARESLVGLELGGLVAELRFDEGQAVERGQVLARLDTQRLAARRTELVAALDQSRADLELAELTRRRVGEAFELNAVSSQDQDEAQKNYQARLAAVRRVESQIQAIDVDIAKAELRSPFDALVAERLVDEGRVIPPGEPLFLLLERSHPEARIGVAGDAVDELAIGQRRSVTVRHREIQAVIKAVLPVRGSQTRSVDVVLALDAEFDGIRSGDLATLEVRRTVAEEGYWLPLAALTESSRGLWSCFVVESAGERYRVARRELVLVHQEEDRVFVRGTLTAGELVVRDGSQRLVPGLEVGIAEASQASSMPRRGRS